MSEWHKADDDDIELDPNNGEINVLVCSNDSGNVYVTLTWDQLDAIVKEKNCWLERAFNDASDNLIKEKGADDPNNE